MGKIKTQLLHPLNHGCRGSGSRYHGTDFVVYALLLRIGGINEHVVHDGSATIMAYTVFANGIKNSLGFDFTKAHINPRSRSNRPRKTPPIAMKQRQHP